MKKYFLIAAILFSQLLFSQASGYILYKIDGTLLCPNGTSLTNITAIGTLSNAAGYLRNNGSGVFDYANPAGSGDLLAANNLADVTNIATARTNLGVATQAEILLAAYPVGSIYISVSSTNPSTLFGGTWTAFAAGRMLVGIDAGDPDFDTPEETGGSKTHTLLESEMPAHTHNELAPSSASSGALKFGIDTNASGSQESGMTTGSTGGGGAHSIMNPYLVCYFWKRTN